ncbi:AraC family transcriptional regulator ligand-binding domain-containing protein [Shimia sp. R10_1]|uniref:AraC family transcriptional regulator n=1 Tax=Shimia sp. R10_1 TaxID=2821095 RepID=UPI001ADB6F4C|nr:AraC family transcriptional regulator [Shimia sp. R10_1]MBO9474816.1 AraC family transcriptional regulator ligand-binding domain-containing protein [Shimia sp. R10_1]
MTHPAPTLFSTVSQDFIQDWLAALETLCSASHLQSLLERSDLPPFDANSQRRVTLDQIVRLYQLAAVETEDEMMGLWSRPIRPRALQHLLTSVREATSLSSALYRFSTFWNLLLDDYQFSLSEREETLVLQLEPQDSQPPQRFGHMLILKLAHGLLSWLARHEVAVHAVTFAFELPNFEEDYAVIFPAPVCFGCTNTSIAFDKTVLGPVHFRSAPDLGVFLENAPRDWIFTRSSAHTQALRVRSFLVATEWSEANLANAAHALHMTPRTLMRRLDTDGTSFQLIKDALRRDIAIGDLQAGDKTIDAIAHDLGFSSGANFHKAFQKWTGNTPNSYRRRTIPAA